MDGMRFLRLGGNAVMLSKYVNTKKQHCSGPYSDPFLDSFLEPSQTFLGLFFEPLWTLFGLFWSFLDSFYFSCVCVCVCTGTTWTLLYARVCLSIWVALQLLPGVYIDDVFLSVFSQSDLTFCLFCHRSLTVCSCYGCVMLCVYVCGCWIHRVHGWSVRQGHSRLGRWERAN